MAQGVKINYTEADLRQAVEQSKSWREVMRRLGYATTNGYLAARLRDQAIALGLDVSRFPLKHVWTKVELAEAIADSSTWSEVLAKHGIAPHGRNIATVRGKAARYGIDYSHVGRTRDPSLPMPFTARVKHEYLDKASLLIAAAWFASRGYPVSLPTAHRPYDLIVEAEEMLYRVQIKTTARRDHDSGVLICNISRTPRRDNRREVYDPADVDFFFIIDVEGNYYILPIREVAGTGQVSLSTLEHRKVDHWST